jgi:uncharacterized protein (TIGR02594 family)
MVELPWIKLACSYTGTREIPGKKHNHKILDWWRKINLPFVDDETPWCAVFVGGVLEECGIQSTRNAAARSYTKWGVKIPYPALGCVVVFWRGTPTGWSGHVGFLVGVDRYGNLMVLGGNQKDMVCISPFDKKRVLSYHWPRTHEVPMNGTRLPVITSNGIRSTNEA